MIIREEEDFKYDHVFSYHHSFLSAHGFVLWQNHFSSFSSNYTIIKTRATNSRTLVLLLHKERIYNLIEQEWGEFQKAFPQYNTVEKMHKAILEDRSILGQICFKHDLLLGILLGFGKENAAFFVREKELLDGVSPPRRLIPSPGFVSIEEEMEAIQKRGGSILIPEEAPGTCSLHWPVGFLVDATKVNLQELRSYYREQRQIATKPYEKGNYLEVSLQALIGNTCK